MEGNNFNKIVFDGQSIFGIVMRLVFLVNKTHVLIIYKLVSIYIYETAFWQPAVGSADRSTGPALLNQEDIGCSIEGVILYECCKSDLLV